MKIAMIGSGAAGSVFASYLRKGGADITLVDPYKEHMEKIAADGMTFTVYPDKTCQLTGFKTACSADGVGVMDIVIFMTKSTQVDAAVETAKPCIGPDTVLVSLMNGLGNEEHLLKAAPPERILYGSGVLGTALDGPGKCISSEPKDEIMMNFGPLKHSPLTDAAGQELERLFNAGGCPCKYWDDVAPLVWQKVIVNCTFNPISALLRLKVKDIMSDPNGAAIAIQVITECCAVATAKGCPKTLTAFMNEMRKSSGSGIMDYYPSMAQDMLMFKRQTEISTLNAMISKYGKETGVPTPANDLITKMVSAIQRNYAKQYQEESK
jgi:2-dehydropantoate 2-reductase